MKVIVNGEEREIEGDAIVLVNLLGKLGLEGHPVVVEQNGKALLPAEQESAEVREGDRLEIVRVVAGG